jgi:DNA polymerase-3 subunit delta
MQLKTEALAAHLGKANFARVYTVASDEALLAGEAIDAIRAAARLAGYTERDVLHAGAKFDWSLLAQAAQGLSLFAQRKIVEIRLPSGKPGRTGGDALRAHAETASDDVLTIVSLPRLDKTTRNSAWAGALEGAGVWIDIARIERPQLPAWLRMRLARQQQSAGSEALEFIADRVEGNLLAAHQEIAKLGLLFPAGELSLEQVTDSVLNVARFGVFDLPAVMLAGDRARAVRVMESLRAEGEPLPLLLWAISEEVRLLLRIRTALDHGENVGLAMRNAWVRREREQVTLQAARRVDAQRSAHLLARCADVDRLFKGLRAPKADADPWLELTDIVLDVAS